MGNKSYLSTSAAIILQAVDNGYKYGFDIMDMTGLPSGTVYPALRKLEQSKFLTSKWEKQSVANKDQRPLRKYYEITVTGREALAEAVKRYRFLSGSIPETSAKPRPSRG
ncbi:MAG TPA: helix-turn-helix transcriptional regulator [Blastocatellia bacterium]|nr:helix-turn-helix transcriptional regulator [Blastocatellia bacterium]